MKKNIEELTLLLMYLTSWEEDGFIADNKLTDENYLYFSKGKSVTLTPEGEKLAKQLIHKYLKYE